MAGRYLRFSRQKAINRTEAQEITVHSVFGLKVFNGLVPSVKTTTHRME